MSSSSLVTGTSETLSNCCLDLRRKVGEAEKGGQLGLTSITSIPNLSGSGFPGKKEWMKERSEEGAKKSEPVLPPVQCQLK